MMLYSGYGRLNRSHMGDFLVWGMYLERQDVGLCFGPRDSQMNKSKERTR